MTGLTFIKKGGKMMSRQKMFNLQYFLRKHSFEMTKISEHRVQSGEWYYRFDVTLYKHDEGHKRWMEPEDFQELAGLVKEKGYLLFLMEDYALKKKLKVKTIPGNEYDYPCRFVLLPKVVVGRVRRSLKNLGKETLLLPEYLTGDPDLMRWHETMTEEWKRVENALDCSREEEASFSVFRESLRDMRDANASFRTDADIFKRMSLTDGETLKSSLLILNGLLYNFKK